MLQKLTITIIDARIVSIECYLTNGMVSKNRIIDRQIGEIQTVTLNFTRRTKFIRVYQRI